jgi:undecaprenyl-diphosphatase
MDLIWALLLALVQGLTEWLPISSSGHLVVIQQLSGLDVPVAFDILLHLGTLASVIAYFWKDILAMLKALFTFNASNPDFRTILLLILGSIPAGLTALFFLDLLESFFANVLAVGVGFIITAIILLLSRLHRGKGEISWSVALVMGLFEALALIPGVSRSGSTISSGLFCGAEKQKVFRFAFLLSIPAIIGATAVEIVKTPSIVLDTSSLAATVVAAVVGYIAIRLAKRFVMSDRFYLFAIYCLAMGLVVIIWALTA